MFLRSGFYCSSLLLGTTLPIHEGCLIAIKVFLGSGLCCVLILAAVLRVRDRLLQRRREKRLLSRRSKQILTERLRSEMGLDEDTSLQTISETSASVTVCENSDEY